MQVGKRINDILEKVYSLSGVEHPDLILKVKERTSVDILHCQVEIVLIL